MIIIYNKYIINGITYNVIINYTIIINNKYNKYK